MTPADSMAWHSAPAVDSAHTLGTYMSGYWFVSLGMLKFGIFEFHTMFHTMASYLSCSTRLLCQIAKFHTPVSSSLGFIPWPIWLLIRYHSYNYIELMTRADSMTWHGAPVVDMSTVHIHGVLTMHLHQCYVALFNSTEDVTKFLEILMCLEAISFKGDVYMYLLVYVHVYILACISWKLYLLVDVHVCIFACISADVCAKYNFFETSTSLQHGAYPTPERQRGRTAPSEYMQETKALRK